MSSCIHNNNETSFNFGKIQKFQLKVSLTISSLLLKPHTHSHCIGSCKSSSYQQVLLADYHHLVIIIDDIVIRKVID